MTVTIAPPFGRNFLPLHQFAWNLLSPQQATIVGFENPNFAGITAGENFHFERSDTAFNGTITFQVGDNASLAAVAARINSGSGGGTCAVVVDTTRIVLTDSNRLRVSSLSSTLFAKIGIPILTRGPLNTVITSRSVPNQIHTSYNGDEISSYWDIPSGSNVVSLYVSASNTVSPPLANSVGMILVWDTTPQMFPHPITRCTQPFLQYQTVLPTFTQAQSGTIQNPKFPEEISIHGSTAAVEESKIIPNIPVPSGATKLAVLLSSSIFPGGSLPYSPPTVKVWAGAGIR